MDSFIVSHVSCIIANYTSNIIMEMIVKAIPKPSQFTVFYSDEEAETPTSQVGNDGKWSLLIIKNNSWFNIFLIEKLEHHSIYLTPRPMYFMIGQFPSFSPLLEALQCSILMMKAMFRRFENKYILRWYFFHMVTCGIYSFSCQGLKFNLHNIAVEHASGPHSSFDTSWRSWWIHSVQFWLWWTRTDGEFSFLQFFFLFLFLQHSPIHFSNN